MPATIGDAALDLGVANGLDHLLLARDYFERLGNILAELR